jgi:hypothetical protein
MCGNPKATSKGSVTTSTRMDCLKVKIIISTPFYSSRERHGVQLYVERVSVLIVSLDLAIMARATDQCAETQSI